MNSASTSSAHEEERGVEVGLAAAAASKGPSDAGAGWAKTSLCTAGAVCAFCVALFLLLICGWQRLHHEGAATLGEVAKLSLKPKGDQRTYQFAMLPNGLKVVSVRDEKALTAAYSVSVKAGSYDDPDALPGLAHFVEHMVFLGSARFPEPSGYDDFVNANGGNLNAYTASEVTVFYTELRQDAADEGMERFSDFLASPLFDPRYMEKEVHAVDSEHAKNVQDPSRRLYEVLNALADPRSPVSRFRTGDLQTLSKGTESSDMRNELQGWFGKHYCPSRMALATYGSESVAAQLARAARLFGNLSTGSRTCQEARKTWDVPASYSPNRMGKWVTVLGTQPQPQLIQAFPLPDLTKEFKSQPSKYIKYILGYGGEKSLLTLLRDDLGLVSSFDVGVETDSTGALLIVSYSLSRQGLARVDIVLDAFFYYLATLRHAPVDGALYASIANVSRLAWDWSTPTSPADTVQGLAEALTRLPPELLLSGDSLIEEPDAGLVADLIGLLVPENMNALLVDQDAEKSWGDQTKVQTVPHYDIKYKVEDVRSRFAKNCKRWGQWANSSAAGASQAEFLEELRQFSPDAGADASLPEPPKPIRAVPADVQTDLMRATLTFGLAQLGGVDGELFGSNPTALALGSAAARGAIDTALGPIDAQVRQAAVAEARSEVQANQLALTDGGADFAAEGVAGNDTAAWYRQGWVTVSPEMQVKVMLRPRVTKDQWESPPADDVRLALYSSLLQEVIAPQLYDRMIGGASYELSFATEGISFTFKGFPALVPDLVSSVVAHFKKGLSAHPSASRFSRVLSEYTDSLRSYSEMPIQYAINDRNVLLTTNMHSKEESLAALSDLQEASVASSPQDLLLSKPLELMALVMGNVGEDTGRDVVSTIQDGLGLARQGPDVGGGGSGEVLSVTPVVRPGRPVELRRRNPRVGDPNDAVVVSLIVGVMTVESRVHLGILGQMLSQVAYNELRTRHDSHGPWGGQGPHATTSRRESRQQLGYVVNAGEVQVSNVHLVSTVVQGNALPADAMEAAVEQVYLELMPARLANLSEAEFQSYRSSYKSALLKPALTTKDEFDHFWSPVSHQGQCYGLRNEMLNYLEDSVTDKAPLVKAWDELVNPKEGIRQKVVVKYFANATARPSKQEAERLWKAHGVPTSALPLLAREYDEALLLERADSATRASLAKAGGYFPQALHCSLPREDTTVLAGVARGQARASRGARGGSAFLGLDS